MTVETLKDKATIRRETLQRRDHIPQEVKEVKDREILETVLSYPPYESSDTVMLYASFRSEVNTFPIIEYALKEGKQVVLPGVNREAQRLDLFIIDSLDTLTRGYMGIMEPDPARSTRADPENIDLIVLPGAAFDEKGGRIGYGGGYYDRLLGSIQCSPHLLALAYEEQIVDHVPLEEHDIKVHAIITDRRIIEV